MQGQPIHDDTWAFLEYYMDGGITEGQAGSPIMGLLERFLMLMAVTPTITVCADHSVVDELLTDEEAVLAGSFWIKMPNVVLCSVEHALGWAHSARESMGREDLCDVCNLPKPLPNGEAIIPFHNIVIVVRMCEECALPTLQSQAPNN